MPKTAPFTYNPRTLGEINDVLNSSTLGNVETVVVVFHDDDLRSHATLKIGRSGVTKRPFYVNRDITFREKGKKDAREVRYFGTADMAHRFYASELGNLLDTSVEVRVINSSFETPVTSEWLMAQP